MRRLLLLSLWVIGFSTSKVPAQIGRNCPGEHPDLPRDKSNTDSWNRAWVVAFKLMGGPNKSSSSLRWFLTLIAFWSTVLLVRIFEVCLVSLGVIPGIFIKGRHIHHFVIGFAVALISLLLSRRRNAYWVLIGIGLGLVTDEFLFWTMLEFDYWSLKNLLAIIATGTLLAVLYLRKRSEEHADPDDFKQPEVKCGGKHPIALQISRLHWIVRLAASILIMVYVFSFGNVALARTRKNVVAHSKMVAIRLKSINHKSLSHLRRRL